MEIRIHKTTKKGITHFKMEIGGLELYGNFSTIAPYPDDESWYICAGNAIVASGYYNDFFEERQILNSCVDYEDIKRLVFLQDLSCLSRLLWCNCDQLLLKWELVKKFGKIKVEFV